MRIFLRLVCSALLLCIAASAQPSDYDFADWLFSHSQFDAARNQYLNGLYDSAPVGSGYPIRRVYDCYMMEGQLRSARDWLRQWQRPKYSFLTDSLRILLGRTYEAEEDYRQAQMVYTDVIEHPWEPITLNVARYRLGVVQLYDGDYASAYDAWSTVDSTHSLAEESRANMTYLSSNPPPVEKRPWIGGLLNLAPGAGYAYAGHYQTAVSTLVVIGLLGYGSYQAYENELSAPGYLLTFLSIGWYLGSVHGAAEAVRRHNDYIRTSYIDSVPFK